MYKTYFYYDSDLSRCTLFSRDTGNISDMDTLYNKYPNLDKSIFTTPVYLYRRENISISDVYVIYNYTELLTALYKCEEYYTYSADGIVSFLSRFVKHTSALMIQPHQFTIILKFEMDV